MKRYRVTLSAETIAGVARYLDYITRQSGFPGVAERWWQKALDAIFSLEQFPNRCPHAPENEFHHLTIRALRVDRCLFLYTVDEEAAVVRVLKFRHGSQRP
jgi:plasmid stabilization system protein ParE